MQDEEDVSLKTLQMARNTGRTWLDCKDVKRADTFLNLAVRVNSAKQETR